MKYYLVLYKDLSLAVFSQPQIHENHQKGARIFIVSENLDISDLSECYAHGWDTSLFPDRLIRKMTPA